MKTEWSIDFANVENFEDKRIEIREAFDNFKSKWENDQGFLEDSDKLLEALNEYEDLVLNFTNCGDEGPYYWLLEQKNLSDKEARKGVLNAEEFSKKQQNKILFFKIKLGKIDRDKQELFLKDEKLKSFHQFLKKVFENSKHVLSEKEEKILSLKDAGSYDMWVKMVESLLAKETVFVDGKELTYEGLINLMRSTDKKKRDLAKVEFEKIMEKYEDVAEVELNAVLETAKIEDDLRGFKRPDESRIKGDLIDTSFVDSILEAVEEKFYLSKKYYSLLAKLVGQRKIGYHERNVDIQTNTKKYSFDDAVNIVKDVFLNLDKEFADIFEEMLNNGKIDVYPEKGKSGGAFCVHFRKDDPIYVLLNFNNNLRDVTTIAHEMGHAINNYFMQKNEMGIYYGVPKATAEVASIFMEDFVFEEAMKDLNEEDKFYLLFKKIGEDLSSIHRQIALYLFELEIHNLYRKEGYLSKERIGEVFVKHMSNYMGEDVTMDNAHLWWIYWSHIRMYFYVYSYASGTLISKSMQEKYREDNSFIEKVKEFLTTGTSDEPRKIFDKMGITIDKSFFLKGLNKIEKDLEYVEELGKKLGKI